MLTVSVGADPEVFVKREGKLVSAYGLVPGCKEHPYPVNNGAVQVDGMALEFNIDPATSEEQFYENIQSVMEQMEAMIPSFRVVAEPVANFGKEYIDSQPEEARTLGCDPDYNAWEGYENIKPDEDLPFRTGAGHVHIGWGTDLTGHDETCRVVVKQLDFFLGLPSLLFDNCVQRRAMYGAAGAYRVKPYGCEYRVLSNKWLTSPELIKWVYRASQEALQQLQEGNRLFETYGDIQEIINNSLIEDAKAIINAAGLEVPNV